MSTESIFIKPPNLGIANPQSSVDTVYHDKNENT